MENTSNKAFSAKQETGKPELTDTAVRKAKAKDKQWKLSDKKGLFVLIHPNGSKYWRMKYRNAGKEKMLSLGVYPDVSLKAARESRDEARKLLSNGVDPSNIKKQTKRFVKEAIENSFESIAREWFGKHSPNWKDEHSKRVIRMLERDAFPWLGNKPIAEINAPGLLAVVRRVEDRGALESAHRLLGYCGNIFRYAIATQRAERDPSGDLKGALPPYKSKSFASITDPKEIGPLLRTLQNYRGTFLTRSALKLAPMLFIRPGELRKAEWSHFDFGNCEWRIPADNMKKQRVHIVPLPKQAIEILKELYPLTGNNRYLFPNVRTAGKPMSENTVLKAIRSLGYGKDQMTGHGFRHMASTILNEQGWDNDAIERQLAHVEGNRVRAAYNYAQYLDERRKMMQHWADYLQSLQEDLSFT